MMRLVGPALALLVMVASCSRSSSSSEVPQETNTGGAQAGGSASEGDSGAGESAGGNAAPAQSCVADSDCRAFSDYCTGCDCRALHVSDPDPPCSGPGVRCLVDPCQGKRGLCTQGRCELGAADQ